MLIALAALAAAIVGLLAVDHAGLLPLEAGGWLAAGAAGPILVIGFGLPAVLVAPAALPIAVGVARAVTWVLAGPRPARRSSGPEPAAPTAPAALTASPTRAAKVAALARHGATPGERAAARRALTRVGGS